MRRVAGLAWLMLAARLAAHDPITTKLLWTQEISRLMNKHCVGCHREGGTAMSLATYDDARPWAKAIRDEVTSRRMPPWGAVKGVGEFRDDPSLSQTEIDMIVNWVEGGAPKGDDAYLAPSPHFSDKRITAPVGREITVTSGSPLVVGGETQVTGLRPSRLAAGDSLEVTAYLPDGAVKHLIWLRDWRPEWSRTYYFRSPLRLPPGTRVAAYSKLPASAALVLE